MTVSLWRKTTSSGGGSGFLPWRPIFPLHPLHLDMLPRTKQSHSGEETEGRGSCCIKGVGV